MRRALRIAPALALVSLAFAPAIAQQDRIAAADAPYAYRQLDDKGAEMAATALMETIRCVECQGQSIANSDAPLAAAMRHEIRTQIESGKEPGEVRQWLIDRYGAWVSYDPGLNAVSAPLYAAPLLLLALGAWLLRRRFGKRPGEAPVGGEDARG